MLWNCGAGEDSWSPLDCKEIKLVNPKRKNPEYSLEGLTLNLKLQYSGHLIWKADSLEKIHWRQKEKGATEDEMVGWHHRLTEHEFEQTPGYSERQGGLACCSSLGGKESDTTEQLNSNSKVCTSLTIELEGLQVSMHWIINPIRIYWTATGVKHS